MRGGRALYVGTGVNGLVRPLSASHDVCWAFQPGDYLHVWNAKDRQDAPRLERLAIDIVGPAYNGSAPDRSRRPDVDDFLFDDEPEPPRPPERNLALFGDALDVRMTELLE
jgi:hypothetical protein